MAIPWNRGWVVAVIPSTFEDPVSLAGSSAPLKLNEGVTTTLFVTVVDSPPAVVIVVRTLYVPGVR